MKRFNELSLNISEDEYRNNGRFHYSDIAGYLREGFSYLIKPEKEESTSLTFGSMVDCIITEGMDAFNEKYCVSKEFSLSDNQKQVIKELLDFGYERLEDIPPQTVIDDLQIYYKNPKAQFTKLLEEGTEYYNFLYINKGKTPVDFKMFQDAIDVANKLLTSESTGYLLRGDQDNIDRFFQLKFNGEYEGIPITAMVDLIYVDHENKQVYPIDLKTTCANYEWEFPKSFVKYRYDVQSKQYSYILRQVMDQDEFYKDYSLEGFIFIYISRDNKHPLIWTFENNLERGDIVIETKNGRKITLEDFTKPLKEMYQIATEQREVPLNIYDTYGNDVIEHLKELKL